MRRRYPPGVGLVLLLLLPLVAACGTSGSDGAARPSISATFSPTRQLPTPTRTPGTPETSAPPTTAPTSAPPTSAAPTSAPPTDAAQTTAPPTTAAPTSAAPTSAAPTSAAPTSAAPTSAAPASSAPTESASPSPAASSTGETGSGGNGWVWLVALVLVAAAVVTWLLVRQARSRRAWEARLAEAEAEAGWFARDLIPQLRGSGSQAGVAGGWTVAAPRVTALDDRLTQLVPTAPGDSERARASSLQDAVRTARDRVLGVVDAEDSATWALDLDAAQEPLLEILVPAPDAVTPPS